MLLLLVNALFEDRWIGLLFLFYVYNSSKKVLRKEKLGKLLGKLKY